MRLLLTRAAEDAARTRDKLEAMGHEVVLAPVIEMARLDAAWPSGVIDAVLATSSQAFAGLDTDFGPRDFGPPHFGPTPETRRLMPLFLVGERTTERARAMGFLGAATVAASAAALARIFDALAARPARLVYLAGRDRKPDIEAALEAAGQAIEVLEVYEARAAGALAPDAATALRAQKADGALHFSRRSAALFRDLVRAEGLDITSITHVCLSEDVATPLRKAGCGAIEVAETPNEAALLALLARLQPA